MLASSLLRIFSWPASHSIRSRVASGVKIDETPFSEGEEEAQLRPLAPLIDWLQDKSAEGDSNEIEKEEQDGDEDHGVQDESALGLLLNA